MPLIRQEMTEFMCSSEYIRIVCIDKNIVNEGLPEVLGSK